ncbi:MAG TPA: sterol desaturase family protein [Saprospiraceae bacterium]|mgnify:CR=1 FL=1|nr:sterol desaturase family protein [Saprospiraceae bacterium]
MLRKYVSNKDESARMFSSDYLEMLTKVHFSIPLIIFLPVIVYLLFLGVSGFELSVLSMIVYISSGLVVWTLTEYILHRFVFHYQPQSEFGKKLHFIMHGVHHDYPNDSKRLVMPPTLSIPLALMFYYLFSFIFQEEPLYLFFSGFLVGYLAYDMLHYAIHHLHWNHSWWKELKNHHMLHHYYDEDKGYGVSSKLWDYVFNTLFDSGAKSKKQENQ